MTRVKVVLDKRAARELMRGQAVAADLTNRGKRIRAAAGAEDHEVQTYIGRNRARVTVRTSTAKGMVRQARDKRLSKALDAGR